MSEQAKPEGPPNYKPAIECCGTCKHANGQNAGWSYCIRHGEPCDGALTKGMVMPERVHALWRCDDFEPEDEDA